MLSPPPNIMDPQHHMIIYGEPASLPITLTQFASRYFTIMSLQLQHKRLVQSLYRESLRMTKSWINRRDLWRVKALEIRHQFDDNKDLTDKYEISRLVKQTTELLTKYRHPDPIIPPQRPDGSSYERNIPTSPLLYKYREGDHTL